MTNREKVKQLKEQIPNASWAEIGRMLGWPHSKIYKFTPLGIIRSKTDNDKEYIRIVQCLNEARMMLGGKCMKCGYNHYVSALDFHHIDPATKEREVTQLSTRTSIMREAKKCILICANCHRELHGGLWTIDSLNSVITELHFTPTPVEAPATTI